MRTVLRFFRALWRAARRAATSEPVLVDRVTAANRKGKCGLCPHNRVGVCALCNCVISVKVFVATESCPDDPPRWQSL